MGQVPAMKPRLNLLAGRNICEIAEDLGFA